MAQSAPGKHYREGITLFELRQIFPDEAAAQKWFEDIIWPDGTRHCPNCGSVNTHECSHDKMPTVAATAASISASRPEG